MLRVRVCVRVCVRVRKKSERETAGRLGSHYTLDGDGGRMGEPDSGALP